MGLIVNVALSCVAAEIVSLRLEPFSAFLPLLPPLHFEPFKSAPTSQIGSVFWVYRHHRKEFYCVYAYVHLS